MLSRREKPGGEEQTNSPQASPVGKDSSAWSPNGKPGVLIPLGCVPLGKALPLSEPQQPLLQKAMIRMT